MLIEIVFLSFVSLIIIFFRKRNLTLDNFNNIEIKGYKILIIAAVVEISSVFLFRNYNDSLFFKVLSKSYLIYPAILYVTTININKHYMKFFFLGTLFNFVAIAFNDFKMPVLISEAFANAEATKIYLENGKDLIHSIMTDETKFKFLCDIITIPPPYPFVKTISVGDIFLLSGIFIFWQEEVTNSI
ncbi:MAG: hypothetical protein K0Q97_2581 [Bacillota bacterium]|nr:hypothetical protein [Bacillota bacterium]